MTNIVNLEATIRHNPEWPCAVAEYKCLDKKCKGFHILGSLDTGLYEIPAVRAIWAQAVQDIVIEIGKEAAVQAGYDPKNIKVVPIAEMN